MSSLFPPACALGKVQACKPDSAETCSPLHPLCSDGVDARTTGSLIYRGVFLCSVLKLTTGLATEIRSETMVKWQPSFPTGIRTCTAQNESWKAGFPGSGEGLEAILAHYSRPSWSSRGWLYVALGLAKFKLIV